MPNKPAGFIETMDCLPVSRLPEGPKWTYEILCCRQHRISYVARDLCGARFVRRMETASSADMRHVNGRDDRGQNDRLRRSQILLQIRLDLTNGADPSVWHFQRTRFFIL